MSDIDLMEPTQDAFFAALKVGNYASGVQVFQHILEGTKAPWVMVGVIEAEDESEKIGQVERHTVEIQYLYQGKGRAPLLAMMRDGRKALTRRGALAAAGASFGRCRWLSAAASEAAPDGVTYAGVQTYSVIVQPS